MVVERRGAEPCWFTLRKLCPFCGGEPHLWVWWAIRWGKHCAVPGQCLPHRIANALAGYTRCHKAERKPACAERGPGCDPTIFSMAVLS